MRVRADVVATKLGIILSFSFHLLLSQKGFTYDFEFLHAFLTNNKNKIQAKKGGEIHLQKQSPGQKNYFKQLFFLKFNLV